MQVDRKALQILLDWLGLPLLPSVGHAALRVRSGIGGADECVRPYTGVVPSREARDILLRWSALALAPACQNFVVYAVLSAQSAPSTERFHSPLPHLRHKIPLDPSTDCTRYRSGILPS